MFRTLMIVGLVSISFSISAVSQTLDQAKRLHAHGLTEDATRAFIALLHANEPPEVWAEALFHLGQIAFESDEYRAALADWEELLTDYGQSPYAEQLRELLPQLREAVSASAEAILTSAVAQTYIRHGDFWSEADRRPTIDVSRLPRVELAIEWYDRTIAEFPGEEAAELAYRRKLSTLLGWEDGSKYGVRADLDEYMPQVHTTFEAFERDFPESPSLQVYRYQISKGYWLHKDWVNTRIWLQRILDAAGDEETFYTQLARARLAKLEY